MAMGGLTLRHCYNDVHVWMCIRFGVYMCMTVSMNVCMNVCMNVYMGMGI